MMPRGMRRRSSAMMSGDQACGASLMNLRNSGVMSGASSSAISLKHLAARPEREAHAALDALRHRLVLAVEHRDVDPGAQPDVLPVALGGLQARLDVLLGVFDAGRRREAADQHAVGDLAGELEDLRAAARDIELGNLGRLPVERAVLEFHHLAVDRDLLAVPERAHQLCGFAQAGDRLGAAVAGQRLEMAARAHADAEAAGRHLGERRGRLRHQRGVARIGIDHAGAEPDARGHRGGRARAARTRRAPISCRCGRSRGSRAARPA